MAIKGITYDNQGPKAADNGELHRAIYNDGILSGCGISYLGAVVTIAAGRIVSAGRVSRIAAAESITIGATEGVARIVYQTDLSQMASRTEFHQLSFVVQTADSVEALPALVQEDINNGGVIYQMEFCLLQLGGPGVDSILSVAPRSGNVALMVSLPVSGWIDGVQTVPVPAVGENSLLIVSPAPSSFEEWNLCSVRATAQARGAIIFTADFVPDATLDANVIMIGGAVN